MSFISDLLSGIEKSVLGLLTGLLTKAEQHGSVSADEVRSAVNEAKQHLSAAKAKASQPGTGK